MSDIDRWISRNYETLVNNVSRITRNKDEAIEILHMCILSLLEFPADKQQRLYDEGKLENYITSASNLQYKSSTSPYHRQNRRHYRNETEWIEWKWGHNPEIEYDDWAEMCECALRELENLHYYYRILIQEKFINGLTYQQMNDKFRISKNSLLRDVKEGLKMLKEKCDETM